MRISDWSSDVCSSDLIALPQAGSEGRLMMSESDALLQRLKAACDALERIKRGELPTPAELAAAPQLDCWYLTEHHGSLALGGFVSGHPTLADGAHIAPSPLLWMSDDAPRARNGSRFIREREHLGQGKE